MMTIVTKAARTTELTIAPGVDIVLMQVPYCRKAAHALPDCDDSVDSAATGSGVETFLVGASVGPAVGSECKSSVRRVSPILTLEQAYRSSVR
jgi:hypothetical protein